MEAGAPRSPHPQPQRRHSATAPAAEEEGATVATVTTLSQQPPLPTNEHEAEAEAAMGARRALLAAAEAARLLKQHGPSALLSAAGAIPSTEEDQEGQEGAGLASLWSLKAAIDGLLLGGAEQQAAAAVVAPARASPPSLLGLSITIPQQPPQQPPSPHFTRTLSASSSASATGGGDTLSAMHPGLPRGATPPRPTSSGGAAAAAAGGNGVGGSGGNWRGHKSPRLFISSGQEQEQEGEEDEDEEESASASAIGLWGRSPHLPFDSAHPLYRRWGAPSATVAVTATPDLLAHVLGFLVPTAPTLNPSPVAPPRYRWPAPHHRAPLDIEYEGGEGPQEEPVEEEVNDEEGPRAACRTLGVFALVSRLWLTAARRPLFWRPILATRLPVLALQLQAQEPEAEEECDDDDGAAGGMAGPYLPLAHSASASSITLPPHNKTKSPPRRRRRAQQEQEEDGALVGVGVGLGGATTTNVYFAALCAYGESVLRRQLLLEGALPRYGDLILGFEVWDAFDGLRLLSASGPFCVVPIEGTILLRLTGRHRREFVGPPFSASSRDPEQGRYKSMGDFFLRQAEAGLPSAVHVRATMTCRRTGRTTLIWESGKEARMKIQSPSPSARAFLPPRSFFVRTVGWTPVNLLGGLEWDNPVAVAAREDQAARGSPLLEARVGFYLQPAPPQAMPNGGEGLHQRDKLWQLAGGDEERYDEHGSFIRLGFNTDDVQLVGRFLQSLLG